MQFIKNNGLLIGVTIAGLSLLISGLVTNADLVSAIGGAIFGASISSWIAKNDILRIEDRTLNTLEKTLNNKFGSRQLKV